MNLADRRGRNSVFYLQQSPVSPGECIHSTQMTTDPQSNRELTALLSTCVSGHMCNQILLPTDGSDGTERAVEHAIDHGTTYDAALHVLYVVESILFHGPITEEAMHDRFETFGPRGDR